MLELVLPSSDELLSVHHSLSISLQPWASLLYP